MISSFKQPIDMFFPKKSAFLMLYYIVKSTNYKMLLYINNTVLDYISFQLYCFTYDNIIFPSRKISYFVILQANGPGNRVF